MKRVATVLLCVMLMFSSSLVLLDTEDTVKAKEINHNVIDYTSSTPFRIDSNLDLAASPKVSAGDGSPGNPWIIENFDIDGNFYSDCIYIGNTTDHLIIRDCYLHDASNGETWPYYMDAGITLYNVENIVIDNNTIVDN